MTKRESNAGCAAGRRSEKLPSIGMLTVMSPTQRQG